MMGRNRVLALLGLWVALSIALSACQPMATPAAPPPAEKAVETPTPTPVPAEAISPTPEKFVFGLILVGPKDDRGWSQAHWEAAQYVLEKLPNTELVWIDKVNSADRPGVTVEQIADDFAAKGAKVIFTTSAEFKDGTNNAAKAHPDIVFIHISGDAVLTGEAPPNVGNIMGRMEYGKMIAGCAAALTTATGKLGYLGPLIDAETRRLVNSTYLGARYCWEHYRQKDPKDLSFTVTWIGFWFNIPGVTLDPTQVANDFFNAGVDVVLSGIDTTEALVVAGQRAAAGERVFAVPYDYAGACAQAEEVCLGVPYFNWGPAYLKTVKAVQEGTWKQSWDWNGPDWQDLNNRDTSAVGWVDGKALTEENKALLRQFIAGLADGSIVLFKGPLNYQDGTVYLKDGEVATDRQIWYTEQLLEGIIGPSR
ncbi:MAG: BMP family ABC transporter substrate-binding protein [Anaerolineae bacterium]|nr:BMP family ABC transporter substrate-binding protein [Anaerolineae bacterium]